MDEGNGKFNLMLLCWGEGHGSSIHDHTNADCFVKVLDGQLTETVFAWPHDSAGETSMTKMCCVTHTKDQVAYICGQHPLHTSQSSARAQLSWHFVVILKLIVRRISCFYYMVGFCFLTIRNLTNSA